LSLRSNSNLVEAEGAFSGLHLHSWVFLRMVRAEAVEVWGEQKAELLEGSGVPKKGLVE